jgi:hypothetical protein
MNDLIKKQTALAETLAQGMKTTRIGDMEHAQFMAGFQSIWARAFMLTGYGKNLAPADYKTWMQLTYEALVRDFPYLRMAEIKLLVDKGATGGYGDTVAVSPQVFAKWVRGYIDSTERKQALRVLKNERDKMPRELPQGKIDDQAFWNDRKALFLETKR